MDLPSPKLKSFLKKTLPFSEPTKDSQAKSNVTKKCLQAVQLAGSGCYCKSFRKKKTHTKKCFFSPSLSLSFSSFSHNFGFFPTTYPEFLIISPQILDVSITFPEFLIISPQILDVSITFPEFLIIFPTDVSPHFIPQMDLVIDLWTVASQVQWKKQPGHWSIQVVDS